jgi:tripartite-type tricarboxylate transporter receptor subunit TctC
VRADLPIRSVSELIGYAKARPGQMNYGVGNAGNKVAVGLLQSLTGIEATEVSYTGTTQAMLELVAGRLDFIISDPLVADPFIKQGAVRALAVTAPSRLASISALPTIADAGVPGYKEITTFMAFYAPRGTSKAVVETLHDALAKAIESPQAAEQLSRMGIVGRTSTPKELAAFNREQVEAWIHLVKVSGLQPQ